MSVKHVGRLLERALGSHAGKEEGDALLRLRRTWPSLVGEELARTTYVRNAVGGVLQVDALHSSAIQMLQLRSRDLCRRLQQDFSVLTVEKVRARQVPCLEQQPSREVTAPRKIVRGAEQPVVRHSRPDGFRALLKYLREETETRKED